MTQFHTAHILLCGSIRESLHHHIILTGNHHELHPLLPVAEALELEVLTDEINGGLFLLVQGLQPRPLQHPTRLHDIGVLCIGRHHEESHTGC